MSATQFVDCMSVDSLVAVVNYNITMYSKNQLLCLLLLIEELFGNSNTVLEAHFISSVTTTSDIIIN